MILLRPDIQSALERSPYTVTTEIYWKGEDPLLAGESIVNINDKRYGVIRVEWTGGEHVKVLLVPMDSLTAKT